MPISVPLKTLYESIGLVITLQTKDGSTIKGEVKEVDDFMNINLGNTLVVDNCGKKTKLEEIYIRGSSIAFFILPPALRFAPFLMDEKVTK